MFLGRELWVMVVSTSPFEDMVGKPNVKYVANMHGDEAVSRELMLHLIEVRKTTTAINTGLPYLETEIRDFTYTNIFRKILLYQSPTTGYLLPMDSV